MKVLTVVLIHIRHATFAPMAQAPAVPPLTADFAALSRTSLNVGASFFSDMMNGVWLVWVKYGME